MASGQEGKESHRATQRWNSTLSPYRRRRFGDEYVIDETAVFPRGYAAILMKSPPPIPPAFLRKIVLKELNGVGKVKVMLRVISGDEGSFFNADKRKKQITLVDPSTGQTLFTDDRRPTIAAPKMFAFDAIFTEDDSQTEICSTALTDVIHAVINGTDGCLFCFGHANLGKSHTMIGKPEAGHTVGAIPCAITWLFRGIAEQRQRTGARFSVRVSCVELTTGQQQLTDLLAAYANDSEQSPAVYLKDDPLFGAFQLQQHSELRASSAERAAFYLDAAVARRHRNGGDSHMLFTLHVYQYSVAGKGGVAGGRSRLHLLDLGNSDRGKAAGGIPLSGLGNILLAIFNGQKHVPYKEHKLTQLLKECLGPLTCHVAMIAHVSSKANQYNETLTTVQLASRIHRMRRRKSKFSSNSTQGNGSSGSSGEEVTKRATECDPSSSDLSADTVIYVGPSTEDATDGEHPPVYLPNFNVGDNRCAMGNTSHGLVDEKINQASVEDRSIINKVSKTIIKTESQQTSPVHTSILRSSPLSKKSTKVAISKIINSSNNVKPISIISKFNSDLSEEQWIDGPKISKIRVAEARHLLKDLHHKKETWIDGPMHISHSPILLSQNSASSYGFMDNHKKIMIRNWVENQSSRIHCLNYTNAERAAKSTHLSRFFNDITTFKPCEDHDDNISMSIVSNDSLNAIDKISANTENKHDIVDNKRTQGIGVSTYKNSKFDNHVKNCIKSEIKCRDEDNENIFVPPPLPLIELFYDDANKKSPIENYKSLKKDVVHSSKYSVFSEDEIFEIIEIENIKPVSMQDSCLQVTEEDITFCMGENLLLECDRKDHPLRILSQENLSIASTFADSTSVKSESDLYEPVVSPANGILPRAYIDHEDFLEQETRQKFEQLARLHQLYQCELAHANVSNSATYQRENSFIIGHDENPNVTEALRPSSRCQSLSLSDVLFNDNSSINGSINSEPAYIPSKSKQEKICNNCRQKMSRPAAAINCLRHPDGASNPNLIDEIERIPGNGCSGSDPEEEYLESRKILSNSRQIPGNYDGHEETKVPVAVSQQIKVPSLLPSSGQMQRKPSFCLNRESYDSGADFTPRAIKQSSAVFSRQRAESSGYDSVVRDSDICSIASDYSRQTSALHERQGGAFGVITSTLCGCFSGGTAGRRVRTPANTRRASRVLKRGRENYEISRSNTFGISWHDVQSKQPASMSTSS